MILEREVYILGKEFKDYIIKIYRTAWHTLSDTILREAIDDYMQEKNINL